MATSLSNPRSTSSLIDSGEGYTALPSDPVSPRTQQRLAHVAERRDNLEVLMDQVQQELGETDEGGEWSVVGGKKKSKSAARKGQAEPEAKAKDEDPVSKKTTMK